MVTSCFQRAYTKDTRFQKLILVALKAFRVSATLCLKQWDVVIICVHVRKLFIVSLMEKDSGALTARIQKSYEKNIDNKRVVTSRSCMNKTGGNYTKLIKIFNSICLNLSPTNCPSEKKVYWKISKRKAFLVNFVVTL